MEKGRRDRSQSGQILILLVLAMVGILGFTALAIDGSMVYSDRRIAQNAADASSVSGAQAVAEKLIDLGEIATYLKWNCTTLKDDNNVLTIGNTAAISHTIKVDFPNVADNNGVETACFNDYNNSYYDKYIDVSVVITDQTQTSFLGLILGGSVENRVEAKTRVFPRTQAGYGMTLLAQNTDDDKNGIDFMGSSKTIITTGGIYSNSYLKIGISPSQGQVTVSAPGGINYITEYFPAGQNLVVSPDPYQADSPIIVNIDPPPLCTSEPQSFPNNDGNVTPGNYDTVQVKGVVNMAPGLYCVTNGFDANASAVLTGEGITIYLIDGPLTINGGAIVNISAPRTDNNGKCIPDVCPPALPGVLIYLPDTNTSTVTMNGNSESTYGGTIYAPESLVKINGGNDSTSVQDWGIQVIADTIEVSGNATLNFTYQGDEIFIGDVMLEVAK